MRKLMVLIAVVATMWGGYWWIGSRAVESGLSGWLDALNDQGISSQYKSLETHGFPNRFDTTITEIDLFDPTARVGWAAPFFQIFALSYKPNHIIAIWPNEQTFQTPTETLSLTSDVMRASVGFVPDTTLEFDRSSLELTAARLTSDRQWSVSLDRGILATRRTGTVENSHDLAFDAMGIRPPKDLIALLDPNSTLPQGIESARARVSFGFDAPWDRITVIGQQPNLMSFGADEILIVWGDTSISAAGSVDIGPAGVPDGRFEITAKNWRRLKQMVIAAGMVDPSMTDMMHKALEVLANLSGDPDDVTVPLLFQNGQMSLGPIPLGPAPRFSTR